MRFHDSRVREETFDGKYAVQCEYMIQLRVRGAQFDASAWFDYEFAGRDSM